MSIRTVEVNREVTGYHRRDSLAAAIKCPGVGSVVMLQAENQNLRYRLDGVDPTPTEGNVLHDGDCITVNVGDGKIQNIRVIEAAAGGILNVHAFR